uniref:Uncharacterized protein n=1 Tax=Rhizophagus irregularis (strain DAOM 181602 / DAOM 197198 / MUCL 43194) TaxID=747089 RepID=U9UFF4_RHIID
MDSKEHHLIFFGKKLILTLMNETALDREQRLPSPIKLEQSRISNPNDYFAIITCIQMTSRLWMLKTEDTNGRLYFDIVLKLDFAKYEVNLIELGGEPVKLINLIDWTVTKGFLAKPVLEINKEIIDPIL